MTNPVHRVRELNQYENILREGHNAIRASAEFVEKQGSAFTETISLKNQLDGIAHLTENGSSIREFIAAWNDAVAHASFADLEVWKRILSLRKQAELELKELIAGWKASARDILEDACATLPDTLSERDLDAALADAWSVPLARLLSDIDTISVPAQVANLPTLASVKWTESGKKLMQRLPGLNGKNKRETGVEERPKTKRSLNSYVTKKTVSTIDRLDSYPGCDGCRDSPTP